MTSGVYLFGCTIYWFFASGELQPWAKENSPDDDVNTMEKKSEAESSRDIETTKF